MDLKIDNNSDLLIEGGDLTFVKNQDALAQHCQMRLATWLGESPYDRNGGTPYRQVIFAPGTSLTAIRFILENRATQTPGITGAVITPVLDPETRELTATGTATSIRGDVSFSINIAPSGVPAT